MPPPAQHNGSLPAHRLPHRGIIVLAVIGLAALLGLGAWQWHLSNQLVEESHADFFTKLREQNLALSEAERLAIEGRFSEAVTKYDAALQVAATDEERTQIMLLKARALVGAGSVADAVPLLKEIVTSDRNNDKTKVARAIAAGTLAGIAARGDIAVNRDIFSDEPFKTLWVNNDPALTLRRVHEYAVSIHPIATSLLNASSWYSSRLADPRLSQAMPAETAAEYVSKVKSNVALADIDIARMEADGTMLVDLRAALLARALVLGDLERYGDTSLGDADAAFSKAIGVYEGTYGEDGIARYYYAVFLAQIGGSSKKEEIHGLLAPLSTPAYANSFVRPLLQNARTVAFYRQFPALIASIDPDFKAFLMTLGWTAADFSS
jgi:tetratricopeptide (TPR) repeat protein